MEEPVARNYHSAAELNALREAIEQMNKFNQVEVLRMIHACKEVALNENKFGIYINLSELSTDLLHQLHMFVQYVNAQESNLTIAEQTKEEYKQTFFQSHG